MIEGIAHCILFFSRFYISVCFFSQLNITFWLPLLFPFDGPGTIIFHPQIVPYIPYHMDHSTSTTYGDYWWFPRGKYYQRSFGKPRDLTRGVTLLGEVAEIPVLKNEEMGAWKRIRLTTHLVCSSCLCCVAYQTCAAYERASRQKDSAVITHKKSTRDRFGTSHSLSLSVATLVVRLSPSITTTLVTYLFHSPFFVTTFVSQ